MQYHLNGFKPGNPDVKPQSVAPARVNGANVLPEKVDVLIAGCGPAGLCLAAQLSNFPEIGTMIVEPKDGPMEKGQADGISVRSMEMFQAFGFAHTVKREAHYINETNFWQPDPANPAHIRRIGRVQDVEDGISEMPHVLINQARVHDLYLEIMRNSPTRLEPDYGLKVADLTVDDSASEYPVTVTLERTDPARAGETVTVRANYVVGCDGARSNVRRAIGGKLHGDAAHQAWGVMDILANTDFPDVRMKAIIQSANEGSILVLPREGGYLLRLYVEMDKLSEDERVSDRNIKVEDVIAKAQRIFQPYQLDVKDVVWWSIYEIGHRLTDTFDDAPEDGSRPPRVFTAGDACHTHSPKAGQGMNVSMGDTFNLGWKLASVLTGRARPELLASYSAERWAAAKGLIDFDHQWSRVVGAAPGEGDEIPLVQRKFVEGGRFTAGLTVKYEPSTIIAADADQALAKGYPIGERFHSAPVIRLADAKPMQLGHVIEAGLRWTAFLFAGKDPRTLDAACTYLQEAPSSPLNAMRKQGDDIDALLDVRAIVQQGFRDLTLNDLPPLLLPTKGRLGLQDHEKAFCTDPDHNIYALREIDAEKGAIVLVRPDQHVAHILPLDEAERLGPFFADVFLPQA